MKRFLSTLLMICLLISLFPAAVSADDVVVTAKYVDVGGEAIAELPDQVLELVDGANAMSAFVPAGYKSVSILAGDKAADTIDKSGNDYTLPDATVLNESFTVVFKLEKQLGVTIDEGNFPDANFRAAVKAFDTVADDLLTNEEIAAVKTINCAGTGIESLGGIAFFTSLEELDCSGNAISNLDLSANAALRSVNCSGNASLSSLNIKGLSNLTVLDCSGCAIGTLDINDCPALETLVHEVTVDPAVNPRVYDKDGNKLVFEQTTIVTHMPNWEESKVLKEAECKTGGEGEREYKCTLCDRTKVEPIPCIDHVMGDGVVDPKPTETSDGVRTFKCKVCGETLKTETVPKVGEEAVELTQLNFFDLEFLAVVSSFDADANGYLDKTEIAGIKSIDCAARGITTLRGVEFLTALETLHCEENEIESLDLSALKSLKELYCYGNNLKALDVSKNTALTTLSCANNQIASLDLSKNTALQVLFCGGNNLSALDLSKNDALTELVCSDNKIGSLKIDACTKVTLLMCENNALSALDISKLGSLTNLNCSGNNISSLNIEKNAEFLKLVHEVEAESADGVESFTKPGVYLTFDSKTKVSHLPKWDAGKADPKVDCKKKTDGKITYTCTVDGCKKTKVETVSYEDAHTWKSTGVYTVEPTETIPGRLIYECTKCHEKKEVEVPALQDGVAIDATHFPDEIFRSYVVDKIDLDKSSILTKDEIEKVTNIDVSSKGIKSLQGIEYFTELETLNCSMNELTTLNLGKNVKLTRLTCFANQIESLNLNANEKLVELFCQYNALKKLEISQCAALEKLFCANNEIASLDLSRLLSLKLLDCSSNSLTSLNISANKSLKAVSVSHNTALGSLNIGSNASLEKLAAADTALSSLDISGCANLRVLDVSETAIGALDISMNPALMNALKNGVKTQLSFVKYKVDCYTLEQLASAPLGTEAQLPYGLSPADGNFYSYLLCVDPSVELNAESYAVIVSRSLFLKGNVGLNFYVTLPDSFEITGDAHAELNGIKVDFPEPNSKGEYLFTYYGAAKEMGDSVVLKLFDAEGNVFPMRLKDGTDVSTGYDFSVRKYFDLAHASSSNAQLLALLDRMSDYGYFAQLAFNYNVGGVSVSAEMLSNVNAVSLSSVSSYEPKISGSFDGGIVHDGSSLILRSETTIRHYFKLTKGEISDYTFVVDGANVNPTEKDGEYYVEVQHIAAKDLDAAHSVQVKNKSGAVVASIENYSALSYVYSVLKTGADGKQETVNLAKSLYNYNKAAEAYFAGLA